MTEPFVLDMPALLPGQAVIYFVTGVSGGIEHTLGTNYLGDDRDNANPCP